MHQQSHAYYSLFVSLPHHHIYTVFLSGTHLYIYHGSFLNSQGTGLEGESFREWIFVFSVWWASSVIKIRMKISTSLGTVLVSVIFYLSSASPFVICSSLDVTIDNHAPRHLKNNGSLVQDSLFKYNLTGSCFLIYTGLYIIWFSVHLDIYLLANNIFECIYY